MIVAHEVTNLGYDRTLLSPMAKQASAALGQKPPGTEETEFEIEYAEDDV